MGRPLDSQAHTRAALAGSGQPNWLWYSGEQ